jgi:hypothetical protein
MCHRVFAKRLQNKDFRRFVTGVPSGAKRKQKQVAAGFFVFLLVARCVLLLRASKLC